MKQSLYNIWWSIADKILFQYKTEQSVAHKTFFWVYLCKGLNLYRDLGPSAVNKNTWVVYNMSRNYYGPVNLCHYCQKWQSTRKTIKPENFEIESFILENHSSHFESISKNWTFSIFCLIWSFWSKNSKYRINFNGKFSQTHFSSVNTL